MSITPEANRAPAQFDHTKYRPFTPVNKTNRRWPDNVATEAPIWCSVDLRDGNQALIEPMTVAQKQQMWAMLVSMGFKEIEVGFPAASQQDFDFVRWLIEANQIPDDVSIQALVQARPELIERTYEALSGANKAIVHVYNSTSPTQREKVFQTDKAGVIELAKSGADNVLQESKKYPDTDWQFEYSPESFSGTEVEFSVEVCNAVIDIWRPHTNNPIILNLPATVESSMPNQYADQIEWFCDNINHRDELTISLHTHNDRGCGVAAAELGRLAGADRIEGTLLGNGERTGNMDIITMAMNLYSQGVDPKLDLSNADDIIRVVESCTNIKTHPRQAWFGELVYTAFSGSHQDAIRKCLAVQQDDAQWDVAYLPIDPRDIGRTYQSVIRVNSQSGKGGASYLLEQKLGIQIPRWVQMELAGAIQTLSEKTQTEVSAEQVFDVFKSNFLTVGGQYQLSGYQIDRMGGQHELQASLDIGGDIRLVHGVGNGAISAFIDALHKATGVDIHIMNFDESALETGTQSEAMAFVQARIGRERFVAAAQDVDTLHASFKAILEAFNKSL